MARLYHNHISYLITADSGITIQNDTANKTRRNDKSTVYKASELCNVSNSKKKNLQEIRMKFELRNNVKSASDFKGNVHIMPEVFILF